MDNKNVIIALALSFAILIGWQFLYVQPQLEAERLAQERRAATAP